jgi:hypothetical protein
MQIEFLVVFILLGTVTGIVASVVSLHKNLSN